VPRTADRRSPDLRPLLARAPSPFAGLDPQARATLLASASRHGLLAAVAGRLPPEDADLRRRFERLAAGARLRDARLRALLEEVLGALGAAGIEPVALKGPALADRVYPDPALRAATDLDLLVPDQELARAADALVAAGFRRDAPLRDAYFRAEHHHLHLHRPPDADVELHFRVTSAFGAALPTGELLSRAVPHRTARGTALLVLAAEDELVTLAVHAAGHLFERAGWLLDLALLVERSPDLDWESIARRARAWRCRRAVSYTLRRLGSLGAAVPDDLTRSLGPARVRVADRLARAALGRSGKTARVLRMGFRAVLRDRLRTVPRDVLVETAWVLRRRTHLLARHLTNMRVGRGDVGPRTSSRKPSDRG
jgi:hypothetical protein